MTAPDTTSEQRCETAKDVIETSLELIAEMNRLLAKLKARDTQDGPPKDGEPE